MLAHVKTHTASFWAQSFIHVLEESIAQSEQSSYTPILETPLLLSSYKDATKRLLCFDYDVNLSIFLIMS
jgi:trehalose 6-phosphate synthase/phosphatase